MPSNKKKKTATLINERHFRATKKNIIVGFGDISGFTNWAHRFTINQKVFTEFILSVHDRYLAMREKGYFVKLLADGLMFVREIDAAKNTEREIYSCLINSYVLGKEIRLMIEAMPYPRPDGFRTRIVMGETWKLESIDRLKIKEVDYIGYIVNLAFRLLNVEKTVPFICHESIKDKTNPASLEMINMKMESVNVAKLSIQGITDDDLQDLWSYGCNKSEKCLSQKCEADCFIKKKNP